ncbi:MAG: nucleoside-diphosphate sugar epimerase/dehydratase [Lysobacteraceae bacterium]
MTRTVARLIGSIHPRLAVVLHDLLMVWMSWLLALRLRYSFVAHPPAFEWIPVEIGIVLIAQGVVLWWTGLYRGLWRFASLPDLWNIARAAALGAMAIFGGLFLFNRLEGIPRSVLLSYPAVLVLALGAPRWLYRYWKDSRYGSVPRASANAVRVLILGAGRAGEALARDLRREGHYRPVGFIDDNRALRGAKVHGVPVLGELQQLQALAKEVAAEMLLIAMPSANNQQMQRVVEQCERTGLPFRTVPRLQDIIDGRLNFNQLKEVAIEDLLGRDPISLDWTAIRTGLNGKRVMITGGGGSIGSELCRQVARLGIDTLIIVDLSEFNLYRIDQELRAEFPALTLHSLLGDCGDQPLVNRILADHAPQIIFHAAAYKHVPLLETQARQAVRNNVLATSCLAQAAQSHGVSSFLLISSDKAVNPANVMGATKRVAEMICQRLAQTGDTRYLTVRFGNVLDSAGSVVPLFREQIQRGGPVTVTHPDITRYFMTIPEACQLILQALMLGEGDEVFALDMGEPVRIRYLAEQMIRLTGKQPDQDIEITYTGLRPGEKLFEELFHPLEGYRPTRHSKIMQASHRLPDDCLDDVLEAMRLACQEVDNQALMTALGRLVPEFESTKSDEVVS